MLDRTKNSIEKTPLIIKIVASVMYRKKEKKIVYKKLENLFHSDLVLPACSERKKYTLDN